MKGFGPVLEGVADWNQKFDTTPVSTVGGVEQSSGASAGRVDVWMTN
jgi:hypothetical protein